MGRASEPSSNEKHATSNHVQFIVEKDVDTAAELASGKQRVLDPGEVLRIRFVALESRFRALTNAYVDARLISISSH
jgi:hypothetical protein